MIFVREYNIMTNFQIYRKVLSFSLLMFLVDLLVLVVIGGFATAGFFIGYNVVSGTGDSKAIAGIIGLIAGFVLGAIGAYIINIFITNRIKAAQIAMMVKGVTEGSLPEKTFHAGFEEVKGRFGSITLFFFITNAIKGVFRQIGRGINRIGTAIGGNTGNSITSIIDSAIQTLIGYLCDCCLGWILFRKDQNAARAGCEGAVIFFRSGKTLFRNIGRIFGMGILSFIVIGGGIFGLSFLLFNAAPGILGSLTQAFMEITESTDNVPGTVVAAVVSFFIAVFLWSALHSVLVRPFILVGVMRNYMAQGQASMPTEAEFEEVARKAPRLRKLQEKIQ